MFEGNFLEINGQTFSPEEIKAYIQELKSLNEYLDAKVRYLSERALPSAIGANVDICIHKDPVYPDRKVMSIGFVYEREPNYGITYGGLKDVTIHRMDEEE